MDKKNKVSRIGIVGYGNLGQYLVNKIKDSDDMTLAFVWNRSSESLTGKVPEDLVLKDLNDFADRKADLIVEVAHPKISDEYGARFLQHSDYMIGSPTTFADEKVERIIRTAAVKHGVYIPSGAFWGSEDIKKMADQKTLQALKISMAKHPSCFRLQGILADKNRHVTERTVLYEGPVRGLCPLAPNNVNTMAAAAIAAHNLGFDHVTGSLISDPALTDFHIVQIDVWGPGDIEAGKSFHVSTTRRNPAASGAVTGNATYASFLSSMLGARDKGPGVHLC